MDDDHSHAESFGALTGIVLTGVILYFAVQLSATANIPETGGQYQFGAALQALVVRVIVGSLVLVNLGITLYLAGKSAGRPGLYALMWLAPLLASMVYPVLAGRDKAKRDALERAHPAIAERHVNLSGSAFWLVPQVLEGSVEPGEVAHVTRKQTLEKRDDPMAEYTGERLAPSFKRMSIYFTDPTRAPGIRKPVKAGPWQDRSAIHGSDGTGVGTNTTYHYFHYADRVEVMPTFYATSPDYRREALTVPLLDVYPYNLSDTPIARLQIDGNEIGLEGVVTPDGEGSCLKTARSAINALTGPLKLRWQSTLSGAAWQEATVTVPPFQQARPGKDVVRSNAVHLYFQADGSVAAQRVQEIIVKEDQVGVRIAEPSPALKTEGKCGTAARAYDEMVEKLGN